MHRPNIFMQFINAIVLPGRNFKAIKEKPFWLLPLILVILGAVIIGLASANAISGVDLGSSLSGLSAQQSQQVEQIVSSPIVKVVMVITTVLGQVAGFFFRALILWALMRLFKGKGRYGQAISVTGMAYLPLFIFQVISAVQIMNLGAPDLSAATQVTQSGIGEMALTLLGQQGLVFVVWNMVLVIWGLSVVFEVSPVKCAICVVGYWLAGFLLSLVSSYASLQLAGQMGTLGTT